MRQRRELLAGLALLLGACRSGPEPVDPATPPAQTDRQLPVVSAPSDNSAKAGSAAAGVAVVEPSATAQTSAEPASMSAPPRPTHKRSRRPLAGQSRLYDRSNPMYAKLQQANQSLAGFPADRLGRVDWVAALRQGLIKPRADRYGKGRMRVLDNDIIMSNTREMPWVRFPHAAHTEWLACDNCHERIFVARRGANRIDMNEIFKGRYCGVCHDRVAFSVFVCERCHSVTHPDSPDAWWSQ